MDADNKGGTAVMMIVPVSRKANRDFLFYEQQTYIYKKEERKEKYV